MIEIICLIWLWGKIGNMARERGKRPGKYRAITFALWFGLETLGTVLGFTLGAFLFGAENAAMIFAYMLGIGGAAAGALIAWQIVKKSGPAGQNGQGHYQGNLDPDYGMPGYGPQPVNQDGYAYANEDMLGTPAEIRLITSPLPGELFTDFYLNGQWVCRLNSGCEYRFRTFTRKNRITTGSPDPVPETPENTVKFIAADNGSIEIHAETGRLLPEQFLNRRGN